MTPPGHRCGPQLYSNQGKILRGRTIESRDRQFFLNIIKYNKKTDRELTRLRCRARGHSGGRVWNVA
jgi:hypothetical protein